MVFLSLIPLHTSVTDETYTDAELARVSYEADCLS